MKALQRKDEGVGDCIDAEPLVGHLVPAATMERHVGLCL